MAKQEQAKKQEKSASENKIHKGDFIEIEFTAKLKDGDVFDSNIEGELKKINPNAKAKPLVFSIGNHMFIEGVDEFLLDKDLGNYEIEISPEKAFGKRNPQLVKVVPLKHFTENKLNPYPGMAFNFDNQIAKVLSVSGGRVITDFNNPLAGKEVSYKINVKRKVIDINEKVKALIDFLFRQDFSFTINEKDKKVILNLTEKQKSLKQFIEIFNDKFKEILEYELTIEETADKEYNKEKKAEKEDKNSAESAIKKEENKNTEKKASKNKKER